MKVADIDGRNPVDVTPTTEDTFEKLANHVARELFHYHGNFTLALGGKKFTPGAVMSEDKDFVAAVEDENAIFQVANAGA